MLRSSFYVFAIFVTGFKIIYLQPPVSLKCSPILQAFSTAYLNRKQAGLEQHNPTDLKTIPSLKRLFQKLKGI